jgi:nucleotide-binding universal stress UspA family protein
MSKIVVGLDGSPGSDRALEAAVEVARRDQATLVLCHVVERVTATDDSVAIDFDAPLSEERIEGQAAELREQGLDVEIRFEPILLGGPGRSIAEAADELGADLIVVGTRGHSALAGVILGSVTLKLLHLAKCPVLCVPAPRD